MDRLKFTTIAHRDHLFCCPLGELKAQRLVALLDIPPNLPVLDIGCGKGELLIRTCERYEARGLGIDTNSEFLQIARFEAEKRLWQGRAEFLETPMASFPVRPESFSAALCVGSSHACGDYRTALRTCATAVAPGGIVLMGEGYWKQDPPLEYLDFLGTSPSAHGSHEQNVREGLDVGLVPLYTATSSEDEWDHYEGLYCRAAERYALIHPEDADSPALRERIRLWRDMYLRHGRSTLGFGFYLFLK